MSRWSTLPRPSTVTEDSELFLVNVLMSSLREVAIESMGPDATPEECHKLILKLAKRGYKRLLSTKSMLSEDGVDDFIGHLVPELT